MYILNKIDESILFWCAFSKNYDVEKKNWVFKSYKDDALKKKAQF